MCPLAIAHGDPLVEDERPASLAHALLSSVEKFPDGDFVFFGARGDISRQSYRSVREEAKRILHGLHLQGLGPGDKVVLYFAACRNFIPALWAAFLGGIVAVPLMLNERSRHDRQKAPELFPYLKKILGASFILTDAPAAQLETVGLHLRDTLRYETLDDGTAAESFFEDDEDHQPRLLILTSGTTALPNLTGLSARAVVSRWWAPVPAAAEATTFLSWAPFDHVMGLSIASPNVPNKAYLPTESFIRQPRLWLDAADRLGVTHGTMTNFGMTLIERQVASLPDESWNLGSIRKIGVGAEAISPRVCRRFVKTLQRFGLRRDAVVLGYGLSECGPVAGGDHHFEFDHSTDSDPFLLLDRPTHGHSVRIVGESGTPVQEDEVGAVQVRGPSMTLGYIGNEEASRSLFTPDGWIRTGDIGLLRKGRLMITGREKETVHINAKKYPCVEIETIAQSISGVEAAFAVGHRIDATDPHERFVLFFVAPSVPQSELTSLKQELSATIAAKFGLAPAYFVQIAAEEVPRTSSGKVQRFQLAASLEAGRFAKVESPQRAGKRRFPSTPIERSIAKTWADLLGFDDFGIDDDFFTLGGDSLQAIGLTLELELNFGKTIPAEALHGKTTISRLAHVIEHGTLPKSGRSRKKRSSKSSKRRRATPLRTRIITHIHRAKNRIAGASVQKIWHAVSRQLPGSPRNFIDDPTKDVQVGLARRGAAPVLLVFCGNRHQVGMPLDSVHRSLAGIGAHIVYLRDFRKFYYLAGVSSLGSDYAASVEALDKLIHDELQADSVHCIGNSAGVYGALQMGLDLGARSVLCLAGPTKLTRSDVAERLARQMPEIIARTPAMLDVRSRYDSAATRPRVRLLYGNDNPRDREHGERLAGLEGVELVPLPGWKRHNVTEVRIKRGEFEADLNWLLTDDLKR